MKKYVLLALIMGLLACTQDRSTQDNQHIYRVNTLKVNCMDVAPMQCLQVQIAQEMDPEGWQ